MLLLMDMALGTARTVIEVAPLGSDRVTVAIRRLADGFYAQDGTWHYVADQRVTITLDRADAHDLARQLLAVVEALP